MLYFWLMAKINEWMNEWNRPSYNFLPYSTILSSCWFGSNHVLCLQVPRQSCWGFRPPILRILVISINVFFFFFFFFLIRPTDWKNGNAFDAKRRKRGRPDRGKKKTLYSCQQKVGLCNLATLSKVAAFGYMFLIFLSLDVKNRARDIYEVTLTKKHDTEKRERFNKRWGNISYCAIMNFLQKGQIMFPLFPLFLTPLLQVFIGYHCISLFVHISGQTTSLNAI